MLRLTWYQEEIKTDADVTAMMSHFDTEKDSIVASGFDTETTGLHHMYDRPFLFQFGWCTSEIGRAFLVDLEEQPQLSLRVMTVWNILAASTPIYLAHNAKFDLHMCQNVHCPYTAPNISDTMIWIRLASDAIPERKGGAPLGLKNFSKKYITTDAKNMDKELKEERTAIAGYYNNLLKNRLGWTKKQIDAFFKDKLNTAEDLPADARKAYADWHSLDLPLWLQPKITSSVTSEDIPYNRLNRKNVKKYALLDIVWVLETYLYTKHVVEVRENLTAVKLENDNIYLLKDMERVGLKIDYDYLVKAKDDLKEYIRIRRRDLCRVAGTDVKCSQSIKIISLLNNYFGCKVDTTESEELSRICSDLKHTSPEHPAIEFIEILQELRTLEKWYSTYIMRFIKDFNVKDGKIYTMINQAGTVSGRVTSDFQQFPKASIQRIDGTELFHPRRMVLAQDGDFDAIVYLDYSQIELRLQAFYTILVGHPDLNLCRAYMPYKCVHISKEKEILYDPAVAWCRKHAYDLPWYYEEDRTKQWTPLDVHGATTKIAFGITEDDPNFHDLRYKGKRVNFAKNYGAQFSKIKEMFPEYDDETIHRIDDAYYKAFPGVKQYHQYCYDMANQRAYMQNLFGVKYYGASGHNLINMLVQGTGAYYLKWKKVQVTEYLKKHHCKSQLMMEIHDELQFKHHKDDPVGIFFDIKEIMEEWDDTLVPIVADMEVTTTNWAEKYEVNNREEFYGKPTPL